MATSEQLAAGHGDRAIVKDPWAVPLPGAERAARAALKAQVAKLERELSGLVATGFPHIAAIVPAIAPAPPAARAEAPGAESPGRLRRATPTSRSAARRGPRAVSSRRAAAQLAGPHLLGLAELERQRDRLVLQIRESQRQGARRDELERDARELLERMKADPRRHKFVRLPVADLGERGCGVWEVRPRLGPIGMLAGWWQLKLSSGCPLPGGPRAERGPVPLQTKPPLRRRPPSHR